MSGMAWPWKNETGEETRVEADVLVLGGGLSGCFAAIAAARRGQRVVLVEKGATIRSGAAGSGFDHWESACTNPGSRVTPREIAEAYVREQDDYSNGIAHYIECREGWDRLQDLEAFGGKIRDDQGEFAGAPFRDEKTGLLYAYDYQNRFTLRVWGSTFKPALYRELKRLGVRVFDPHRGDRATDGGGGWRPPRRRRGRHERAHGALYSVLREGDGFCACRVRPAYGCFLPTRRGCASSGPSSPSAAATRWASARGWSSR